MAIPLDQIVIQTINGIVNGMILALVASGLTLIFGIMDVVNFAHGELFMLGAYVGATTIVATGSFWLALLVAAVVIAAARRGPPGHHAPAAARARSPHHDPGHLRHLARAPEVRALAVRAGRPARSRSPSPATSRSSTSSTRGTASSPRCSPRAIIGALYLFLKYGKYGIWIRATTQDRVMASAMGIPVPWVHTAVFAIGAGMAAASGVLFGPLVGVTQTMGLDFTLRAFIVVVVGGMGNLGGSILASIFISLLEAYASLVVSPAQAVIVSFVALILTLLFRPDRPLRPDPQVMSAPRSRQRYWIGFAIVLALLVVAPLVLPEFWRRFVTEILIWGLLAMSSDILIGYTGMVSFGHSAFFGLGMYGAAAALLSVRPPNLWLALLYGLVAAAVVAVFVAYFSTRLRDIYFSITTLVFSQIFYVIIFTWTEVTGGENGLTFSQPRPRHPRPLLGPVHHRDAALVRARGGDGLLPAPPPDHPVARSAWCCSPSARTSRARARSATTSSATRSWR